MYLSRIKLMPEGLELSRIVTGVWRWGSLSSQDVFRLIESSLEHGITTFDHADIYGGYTIEEIFGKALHYQPSLRQKIQLITKCGIKLISPNRPTHAIKSYDTSALHIKFSVENSLKMLKTDYLDLLLIHRPSPLMNADEIAETFAQLRKEGKVKHFGVSNFTSAQFQLLNSRFPLVTNQIEISVYHLTPFTDGTLDQCQQLRVSPMAWSPLGSGKIFQHPPQDAQTWRLQEALNKICSKYQVGYDTILLSWLLQHPAQILPILGTTNAHRFKSAIQSLDIKLTQEEWFMLWTASTGKEVD
ncbi:MAG: aldo/keto reductase [Flammeovirgaceae bacterium]